MTTRLTGLELYAGNPLDSGTAVGSFATARNIRTTFSLTWTEEVLQFDYLRTDHVDQYFHEGMFIVRAIDPTLNVTGTDRTSHWLVRKITRDTPSGVCSVICDPIAVLLKDILVYEIAATGFPNYEIGDADKTAKEHFDARIASLIPSWTAKGTFGITNRLDFQSSRLNLAQWCDNMATAIGAEFRFRYNSGTGKYNFDFVEEIGSGSSVVLVCTGKNIQALQRAQDYDQACTKVEPFDVEKNGLWYVEATVATKSVNDLTLADNLGRDIDMVPVTGCLDSLYLVANTATYSDNQIVSSTAPNAVTMTSGASFATGDTVVIRRGTGATGERLRYIHNQAAISANYESRLLPLDRKDIVATRNLIKNGFMREYTTATSAPDGYTLTNASGTGATCARSTSNTEYGGFSARIRGAATNARWEFTTPLAWGWDVGPDSKHCLRVRLTIAAKSSANIEVQMIGTGAPGFLVELGTTGLHEIVQTDLDLSSVTAGTQIQISGANGGGTTNDDVYVDVMQITPGGDDPQVYVEGSNGNLLYKAAGDELIARNPSARNYTLTFADLGRLAAPNEFSGDQITLGGNILLESDELDIAEQVRVVRYQLNDDHPEKSVVALQGKKERMLAILKRQQDSIVTDNITPIARRLAAEVLRTGTGDTSVAFSGTTAGADTFEITTEQVAKSFVAPRLRSVGKTIPD